ncbi:DUF5335 domain-containing protein [Stigmatella aurantiaca]|uniref:Conserved uncharacterized protein n=1 Tax=Stigmatella aurantiaca (strain DW4/3-1) TaxID=378806 RepID=Q09E99_STIAD|nr:DUF5335 domain-containing protein [Stigmatella aurantiaca]ADO74690.1 conserved uncharacterized protein [Stigmatella aurantiaca DW4/3-1]EAU70021.1 hypothetical protein STIAU_8343 [Stigmatella aurantiaca DW4/3-1]
MERTMEIPHQGWSDYFASLSRRALNHPIRVEVESGELGAQELVRALPLVEIEVETKGSEMGDIELTLGSERQDFMHRIAAPAQVYLKIDEDGNLECLSIEDHHGERTLLFFEGDIGVPAWPHSSGQEAEPPAQGL